VSGFSWLGCLDPILCLLRRQHAPLWHRVVLDEAHTASSRLLEA